MPVSRLLWLLVTEIDQKLIRKICIACKITVCVYSVTLK